MHATSLPRTIASIVLVAAAFAVVPSRADATPSIPIITPAGGYYKGTIQAGLQSPGPTATIYYTTDGSTPSSTHGTVYVGGSPVSVAASLTLQAVAYDGANTSAVASAAFDIGAITTVGLQSISPNGGNYPAGSVSVSLSSLTSGATIYYTTDGTVPTTGSYLYSAAFNVSTTATVRAIAVKSGLVNSGIAGAAFNLSYSVTTAAPTLSPSTESFTGWATVTMTSSTPGAVVRYTTDGSTPTASSTQYTGPKFVGVSTTLKARAFANGDADSAVTTATYTADTTAPTSIDVTTYGASISSSDNTVAVQAALNAAKNVGVSGPQRVRVFFPTGTYQFKSGLVPPTTNNLVIDGQGSTLIFAVGVVDFGVNGCNNFTLENMIINTALPTATPATVTEVDSTGFDCLLDPGFLAANVSAVLGFIQTDPVLRDCQPDGWNGYPSTPPALTPLGLRKLRLPITTSSPPQGAYAYLRQSTAGQHAVNCSGCDGVKVSNVTLYGSTSMGVTAGSCCDVSLVNVNTLVAPGSGLLTSAASDGSHFTADKGVISYQDCEFQAQGDDGINVCGNYYTIQSVSGNQINIYYQKSGTSAVPSINVGEVIEFRTGTGMLQTGTATVTAITQLGGTPTPVEQLTLASAPPAGIMINSDVVDSLTWLSRISVVRCNFMNNRARGMLLQTPNVFVENCRFENVCAAGINVSTVLDPWYESSGVSNVQILNNSFENCNRGYDRIGGNIWVYANNQSAQLGSAGVHKNVVIADNTIRDTDDAAVVIDSASNVDLLNNTFENVSLHPTLANGTDAVFAANADDVRINNNTGLQTNYVRYAYDLYLPYANPPASGSYNVQPFLIAFSQTAAHMVQWTYSWDVQSALPTSEAMFVHVCDSSGNIVTQAGSGGLPTPDKWDNGSHVVSASVSVDLTAVKDGTYTVRVGIYPPAGGARLGLLGDDDGTKRIITGTLTIAGSGSTITFASQQVDVKPTVSHFVQSGPREFAIAYTWVVNDTVPTGEVAFVHLCDSTGGIVQSFSPGTLPVPSTWTPGTQVVSSIVNVTLATGIADGTYTVRMGLYAPTGSGARLPLNGHNDGNGRIIAGTLTTGTGPVAPINWDSSATNVSSNNNTGF